MKPQLLFPFFFLFFNALCAQINYEKGYFIDAQGNRQECWIKNVDWRNTPQNFQFKLKKRGQTLSADATNTREFSIYKQAKYQQAQVKIDRSSDMLNDLDTVPDPRFTNETLFLHTLVEGKASLYLYRKGNLSRYFYKTPDAIIAQLVHKRYFVSSGKVAQNIQYRQQLWRDVKCDSTTILDINAMKYERKALVNYFLKYNQCAGSPLVNYDKLGESKLFNLSLRPGWMQSSLYVHNDSQFKRTIDFGSGQHFRLGLEAAFTLPFNQNKWAITLEPTYQAFKASQPYDQNQEVRVNYRSVEIPVGLRYHLYLNNQTSIFANAAAVIDIAAGSGIDFDISEDLNFNSNPSLALGLGLKFNKYSLELRRGMKRQVMKNYNYWDSEYKSFSLVLGYQFF
ncbi:tRNA modification GTPase [Haliscomenobacter hydrossis]|uniref:tRNA modification GTPase n=1 Tax=Haliscomenobacter hydrossis (strain ATCC 27775 / DSM 1100 / LMG 10767 / O) TaxID=760192 RepID=F4KUG2_HALH1|nr:tRNA modification GTPase [Haliscomenobacter hydrossis]AEE51244.1 tRNA modification GTPase [Haliscomenobacter hydrossis DSM 1100]